MALMRPAPYYTTPRVWPTVEAALAKFRKIITTPVEQLLTRIYLDNAETPAAYNELWRRIYRQSLSIAEENIIKKSVDATSPSAIKLLLLGDLYQYGIGVAINKQQALYYYHQVIALEGNAAYSQYACGAAHWCLARFYLINERWFSLGSQKKARYHFEKAIDHHNDNAMVDYGDCWEIGRLGFKQDSDKATAYYEKAAQQKNGRAYHNLAVCYDDKMAMGKEIPFGKVYALYIEAAALGYDAAVANLATLFVYGDGLLQDASVALACFEEVLPCKLENSLLLLIDACRRQAFCELQSHLEEKLLKLVTYISEQRIEEVSPRMAMIIKNRVNFFCMRYHVAVYMQDTEELKLLWHEDFPCWVDAFAAYDSVKLEESPVLLTILNELLASPYSEAEKKKILPEQNKARVTLGFLLERYATGHCQDFAVTTALIQLACHLMEGVDIKNLTPNEQCELGHFYYAHQSILPLSPALSQRTAQICFFLFLQNQKKGQPEDEIEVARAKVLLEKLTQNRRLPPLPVLPQPQPQGGWSPLRLLHGWRRYRLPAPVNCAQKNNSILEDALPHSPARLTAS